MRREPERQPHEPQEGAGDPHLPGRRLPLARFHEPVGPPRPQERHHRLRAQDEDRPREARRLQLGPGAPDSDRERRAAGARAGALRRERGPREAAEGRAPHWEDARSRSRSPSPTRSARNDAVHPAFLPARAAGGAPDLLVVAGEHSGDEHAARMLARAARPGGPGCASRPSAGPRLAAAGRPAPLRPHGLSVVGLVEVLRNLSFFRALIDETLRWIADHRPRGGLLCGLSGPQPADRRGDAARAG